MSSFRPRVSLPSPFRPADVTGAAVAIELQKPFSDRAQINAVTSVVVKSRKFNNSGLLIDVASTHATIQNAAIHQGCEIAAIADGNAELVRWLVRCAACFVERHRVRMTATVAPSISIAASRMTTDNHESSIRGVPAARKSAVPPNAFTTPAPISCGQNPSLSRGSVSTIQTMLDMSTQPKVALRIVGRDLARERPTSFLTAH